MTGSFSGATNKTTKNNQISLEKYNFVHPDFDLAHTLLLHICCYSCLAAIMKYAGIAEALSVRG